MFRARCKKRAGLLAGLSADTYIYQGQGLGGGGGGPSDIAALAIHIRKGGVSITVDTYSVQERLYVLEYRSPTEGGKGGGGDNFCGSGDNIC